MDAALEEEDQNNYFFKIKNTKYTFYLPHFYT